MKIRLVLLYIFSFLIVGSLTADKIVIQNFNQRYGLPKNIVNCMCMLQDSKGFLWFGMANGLYKFDLNSFTYFNLQRNKISGFPESDIRAIVEYAPGLLLVGTYNKGLLIYNTIAEKFESISCNSTIDFSKLYVHCIYLDKTGSIWMGTFDGLFKLKYSGKQINKFELLERFDTRNSTLAGDEILGIMESNTGVLWFLTMSDIGYYDTAKNKIITFESHDSI